VSLVGKEGKTIPKKKIQASEGKTPGMLEEGAEQILRGE